MTPADLFLELNVGTTGFDKAMLEAEKRVEAFYKSAADAAKASEKAQTETIRRVTKVTADEAAARAKATNAEKAAAKEAADWRKSLSAEAKRAMIGDLKELADNQKKQAEAANAGLEKNSKEVRALLAEEQRIKEQMFRKEVEIVEKAYAERLRIVEAGSAEALDLEAERIKKIADLEAKAAKAAEGARKAEAGKQGRHFDEVAENFSTLTDSLTSGNIAGAAAGIGQLFGGDTFGKVGGVIGTVADQVIGLVGAAAELGKRSLEVKAQWNELNVTLAGTGRELTTAEFDKLAASLKALPRPAGMAQEDLAALAAEVAAFTPDTAEIAGVADGILNLSRVSKETDLGEITEGVGRFTAVAGDGKLAADILAQASVALKGAVGDNLGAAMGEASKVGAALQGTLKGVGQSAKEGTVIFTAFAKSGLDVGDASAKGEEFAGRFRDVINDPALKETILKSLPEGISAMDAGLETGSESIAKFAGTIAKLGPAGDKVINTIGGGAGEALRAMAAATKSGAVDVDKLTKSFDNVNGAAARTAAALTPISQVQEELAKARMDDAILKIGGAFEGLAAAGAGAFNSILGGLASVGGPIAQFFIDFEVEAQRAFDEFDARVAGLTGLKDTIAAISSGDDTQFLSGVIANLDQIATVGGPGAAATIERINNNLELTDVEKMERVQAVLKQIEQSGAAKAIQALNEASDAAEEAVEQEISEEKTDSWWSGISDGFSSAWNIVAGTITHDVEQLNQGLAEAEDAATKVYGTLGQQTDAQTKKVNELEAAYDAAVAAGDIEKQTELASQLADARDRQISLEASGATVLEKTTALMEQTLEGRRKAAELQGKEFNLQAEIAVLMQSESAQMVIQEGLGQQLIQNLVDMSQATAAVTDEMGEQTSYSLDLANLTVERAEGVDAVAAAEARAKTEQLDAANAVKAAELAVLEARDPTAIAEAEKALAETQDAEVQKRIEGEHAVANAKIANEKLALEGLEKQRAAINAQIQQIDVILAQGKAESDQLAAIAAQHQNINQIIAERKTAEETGVAGETQALSTAQLGLDSSMEDFKAYRDALQASAEALDAEISERRTAIEEIQKEAKGKDVDGQIEMARRRKDADDKAAKAAEEKAKADDKGRKSSESRDRSAAKSQAKSQSNQNKQDEERAKIQADLAKKLAESIKAIQDVTRGLIGEAGTALRGLAAEQGRLVDRAAPDLLARQRAFADEQIVKARQAEAEAIRALGTAARGAERRLNEIDTRQAEALTAEFEKLRQLASQVSLVRQVGGQRQRIGTGTGRVDTTGRGGVQLSGEAATLIQKFNQGIDLTSAELAQLSQALDVLVTGAKEAAAAAFEQARAAAAAAEAQGARETTAAATQVGGARERAGAVVREAEVGGLVVSDAERLLQIGIETEDRLKGIAAVLAEAEQRAGSAELSDLPLIFGQAQDALEPLLTGTGDLIAETQNAAELARMFAEAATDPKIQKEFLDQSEALGFLAAKLSNVVETSDRRVGFETAFLSKDAEERIAAALSDAQAAIDTASAADEEYQLDRVQRENRANIQLAQSRVSLYQDQLAQLEAQRQRELAINDAAAEETRKKIQELQVAIAGAQRDVTTLESAAVISESTAAIEDQTKAIEDQKAADDAALDRISKRAAAFSKLSNAVGTALDFVEQISDADSGLDVAEAAGDLTVKIGNGLLNSGVPPLAAAGAVLLGAGLIAKAVTRIVRMFAGYKESELDRAEAIRREEERITAIYEARRAALEDEIALGDRKVDQAHEQIEAQQELLRLMLAERGLTVDQLAAEAALAAQRKAANEEQRASNEAAIEEAQFALDNFSKAQLRDFLERQGVDVGLNSRKAAREYIESLQAQNIALEGQIEIDGQLIDAAQLLRDLRRAEFEESVALLEFRKRLGEDALAIDQQIADERRKHLEEALGEVEEFADVDFGAMSEDQLRDWLLATAALEDTELSPDLLGLAGTWLDAADAVEAYAGAEEDLFDKQKQRLRLLEELDKISDQEFVESMESLLKDRLAALEEEYDSLLSTNATAGQLLDNEIARLQIEKEIKDLIDQQNGGLGKGDKILTDMLRKRNQILLQMRRSGSSADLLAQLNAVTAQAVARLRATGATEDQVEQFEASLPQFATGGYIPNDVIAKIHAGEYVLSADAVKAAGGAGFLDQLNQQATGAVDAHSFFDSREARVSNQGAFDREVSARSFTITIAELVQNFNMPAGSGGTDAVAQGASAARDWLKREMNRLLQTGEVETRR